MSACVVPGCKLYTYAHSIGIPFHHFPKDNEIRKQWLIKIRNQALPVNSTWDKVKNLRVCGKHFHPSDYERDLQHELTGSKPRNILKKSAVPSIFTFVTKPEKPERSAYTKREELRKKASKQLSFAFGSASQQQAASQAEHTATVPAHTPVKQPQVSDIDVTTDTDPFSSPFKLDSPKSSPFKPGTSEDVTTTETSTESEGESQSNKIKVIVEESKITDLFKRCQRCGEGIVSKNCVRVGAKLSVLWECIHGHEGRWESTSNIRGMPTIHLQAAAAILFSGNTYQSVKNLAEILNLQLFSKATFNNIQNTYLLPVIDSTYQSQYYNNMAMLVGITMDGESVSLLGDGRSDSPGYSAKYTTYSVMEEGTQKIVEMKLVQVTEATSSVAMEKEGFLRSMESILHHGVKVDTFTTDRSPSIRKVMKDSYKDVNHQFDCWHICKGVKKKCMASGRKKGHEILTKWTKSITNHLWYSCSACGGDAKELKRLWESILHHVTGVHRWEDKDGTARSCQHDPLSQEEQESRMWFDPTLFTYM